MINFLRILGSSNLIIGYIIIAGSPFKSIGIAIRISGHLARLPYSFKHNLKDFIGFHVFFTIVEIILLIKNLTN